MIRKKKQFALAGIFFSLLTFALCEPRFEGRWVMKLETLSGEIFLEIDPVGQEPRRAVLTGPRLRVEMQVTIEENRLLLVPSDSSEHWYLEAWAGEGERLHGLAIGEQLYQFEATRVIAD